MSSGPTFSWNIVSDLRSMWAFPFMQNAFLAGTLIAVVAGLVGYFVVIRRSAFANHALGHTGFSGAAAAVLIGVQPVYGLLVFTMATGTGMGLLGTRASNRDVEIGTMLAFALGLGLLFLSLYQGYATEAYSILFGEVLGIDTAAVWLTFWATLAIIVVTAVFYRPLLFSSLDEDVAEAKGMSLTLIGVIFMLLLAVTISIAVQVIGVLLIFALMVTPAAIAIRLTQRSWAGILVAIAVAMTATWGGLFISWYEPYPVSFFIVSIVFVEYLFIRGSLVFSTSSLLQAQDVPEASGLVQLRNASVLAGVAQVLALAGVLLIIVALFRDPGLIFSASIYSAYHVAAILVGAGVGLGAAASLLYFVGFRRMTMSSREFAMPTFLSLVGVLGLVLGLVGFSLELYASTLSAAGNALAPVAALFGAPLFGLGVLLAFLGFIGQILGTWRIGLRYKEGLFKAGAVLMFLLPFAGYGLSSLGFQRALARDAPAPVPPRSP